MEGDISDMSDGFNGDGYDLFGMCNGDVIYPIYGNWRYDLYPICPIRCSNPSPPNKRTPRSPNQPSESESRSCVRPDQEIDKMGVNTYEPLLAGNTIPFLLWCEPQMVGVPTVRVALD